MKDSENTMILSMDLTGYKWLYLQNQRKLFLMTTILAAVLLLCVQLFWTDSFFFTTLLRKPCNKYLPKVVLFGVAKSGTGVVRMFLNAHPDIDVGPGKTPETGVWEKPSVSFFDLHYEEGLDWYRMKMPCSDIHHLIIDHTPQYFKKAYVPKRVYMYNHSIRLLLVIRDPVRRAISQYLQMKDGRPNFDKDLDVESFLSNQAGEIDNYNPAISQSLYILHLSKWLKLFKLNQIYIVNGDEFAKNPLRQLTEIETFLGVKPFFTPEIVYFNETRGFYCVKLAGALKPFQCGGKNKGRTHPQLKDSTMLRLQKFFKPYNERLFRVIGKRFNWTSNSIKKTSKTDDWIWRG